MEEDQNEESSTEGFDIRIVIKKDAKTEKDQELYRDLKEIMDYLDPIKPGEVIRFLIKKAYDGWFLKEKKKK